MKETNTSKLINYYAEALFDVAKQENESEEVFEQASFLSAELSKDPKNIQRLSNPIWSNESKKQVLTDFASKKGFKSSLIK
ncbi:MAG: F0F1 ATP synthase subunit delta, partial [Alphaproteobacteria bacterium]|nr:F0F1 ATP synthase subunit delta [Alphaproteobacteria bacterium]